jgi:hypothetical protein
MITNSTPLVTPALAPILSDNSTLATLPGIAPDTVRLAAIQYVSAKAALILTGLESSGLLIPYTTIDGNPVSDGGQPFMRLRLDNPRGSQKYHQRAGSKPHAYIPPIHQGGDRFEEIILVEGEKKALALSDAGECAFGISGFYGGATRTEDGRWVPVAELEEIRRICPPEVIYLAGDQDTLLNGQFYDAAIKLREAFPNTQIYCLQVPANAPGKGFDDCRAVMEPGAFAALLQKAKKKAQSIQVTDKSTVGSLALKSLKAEWSEIITAFEKGGSEEKTVLRDNLVKLTASLKVFKCELDAEQVVNLAVGDCRYGRRAFNAEVKEHHKKAILEMQSHDSSGKATEIIKTSHQGVWSAEAAEVLGKMLFWHGRKFADVTNGDLTHFSATAIATYLDKPDRCQFFRINREGFKESVSLTADDAEYIESVPTHQPTLVRHIEVISSMPVLIWRRPGYELVTGYDRESRVYAGGTLPTLPSVEEAKAKLLGVIGDFKFSNDYEKARCIAFLLTPAIVRSGALGQGRCPLFYVSKDQKGAGGGYLVKLVAAVYGMRPGAVVIPENTAERSKEGVSMYLSKGNHLVYLDNVRGEALKRLSYLESLLTEPNFEARSPYMQCLIDVRREVFACTSNGAIMSDDLADRTIEVRIAKQPRDYLFTEWPEGDLLAHVEASRAEILASIYVLIQCYDEAASKSQIGRRGFRFREWEHALTWIITNLFPELPGLLEEDYLDRKKVELTDPHYSTLVEIFRVAATIHPGEPCSTSQLVELAREKEIPLRGENPAMELGKQLTRHFQQNGAQTFAGKFHVNRTERTTPGSHGNLVKFYSVTFLAEADKTASPVTGSGSISAASTGEPSRDPASFTVSTQEADKSQLPSGVIEREQATGAGSVLPSTPTLPLSFRTSPPPPVMPPLPPMTT